VGVVGLGELRDMERDLLAPKECRGHFGIEGRFEKIDLL